ncbi:hypothetical protein [Staphylococcus simiae]|uniref:Uncharacterized protein n=1 Tax=Staphylococcus simiae CCM 7213 = CCUG 51256 TaxID=911238 RepID=G5JH63_9STAP|nr:hypothetical protein [Staphylococcus simiae]EHJ08411.1 hypothetical protein SS7213T_03960 [Staphylococcus simiae CCM 7213 = CCUG 51256]PNZ12629.1 hypothetical protein CD113_06335 [Staphylococcus simiae]SNV67109.1 phage protein [Staphylococcus simiae]
MAGKHSKIKIDGKYGTVLEFSLKYGVPISTILTRYNRGIRGEELIIGKIERAQKFDVNGEMLTIKEIAEKAGATDSAIYNRIKQGYKGDALIMPTMYANEKDNDSRRITKEDLRIIAEAEARHEQAIRDRKRAKQKVREKERLAMIAKHRVRSDWFVHLEKNDIFPKVKRG